MLCFSNKEASKQYKESLNLYNIYPLKVLSMDYTFYISV